MLMIPSVSWRDRQTTVFDHLNSISPSITFTVEQETEGRLGHLRKVLRANG